MEKIVQPAPLVRSFIRYPTQVEYGVGKILDVGRLACTLGTKAYVLMDPFFEGTEIAGRVLSALRQQGLAYADYYDVRPNPRAADIDAHAQRCREGKCDVVIALGGGGTLDIGKAVAALATNDGGAWDYTVKELESYRGIDNPPLPSLVIPTTSGTGSEATIYSVVTNPDIQRKCTIRSFYLYPTVAILDPQLLTTVPPQLTALTGIDTFAHAFESYTNKNATLYSRMVARESMRLFIENIVTCVENGADLEARGRMAFSSLLGGIAIAHSPTTLPHVIGQCLSGWVDAPHGGSLAVCLPEIIRWTLPCGAAELADVARMFRPQLAQVSDEEAAGELPNLVEELFCRILNGQDVNMRTYGMTEDRIDEFSDFVFDNYQKDIGNYLRMPTRQELHELIRSCL